MLLTEVALERGSHDLVMWGHRNFIEDSVPNWSLKWVPKHRDQLYYFTDYWNLNLLFSRPELSGVNTSEEQFRKVATDVISVGIKFPSFSPVLVNNIRKDLGIRSISRTHKVFHPWVEGYKAHLEDTGASKHAVKDNPIRAQQFVEWLQNISPFRHEQGQPLNLRQLEASHGRAYVNYLARMESDGFYTRNTIAGRRDVAVHFLRYCHIHYRIMDISSSMKPFTPQPNPNYWIPTEEEVEHFFEGIAAYSPTVARDASLFALLLTNGLRPGEAINLEWKGTDLSSRSITFVGKGPKIEMMEIPGVVRDLLRTHRKNSTDASVFVSDQWGEPRRLQYLRMLTAVYARMANWPVDKVQPYTFRHTFCTRLLEQTGDYILVNELARHNDLNKTKRYVHLTRSHTLTPLTDAQARFGI